MIADEADAPSDTSQPASETLVAVLESEPPNEMSAQDNATSTPIEVPEGVEAEVENSDAVPPTPPSSKRWYVIKVASNREDSTKRNIERQVKVDNLESYFGKIEIPVDIVVEVKKVTDTTKAGDKTTKTKKVEKKIKKFPGYIMAELEWTPEVGAMLRGVSGVGGFLGEIGIGKPPPPMTEKDVQRMLGTGPVTMAGGGELSAPDIKKKEVVKLNFEKGDKVRIRDGAFANFEGEVKAISEPKEGESPIITVEVQVLGRPTSIEMEFWQVDKL